MKISVLKSTLYFSAYSFNLKILEPLPSQRKMNQEYVKLVYRSHSLKTSTLGSGSLGTVNLCGQALGTPQI